MRARADEMAALLVLARTQHAAKGRPWKRPVMRVRRMPCEDWAWGRVRVQVERVQQVEILENGYADLERLADGEERRYEGQRETAHKVLAGKIAAAQNMNNRCNYNDRNQSAPFRRHPL